MFLSLSINFGHTDQHDHGWPSLSHFIYVFRNIFRRANDETQYADNAKIISVLETFRRPIYFLAQRKGHSSRQITVYTNENHGRMLQQGYGHRK